LHGVSHPIHSIPRKKTFIKIRKSGADSNFRKAIVRELVKRSNPNSRIFSVKIPPRINASVKHSLYTIIANSHPLVRDDTVNSTRLDVLEEATRQPRKHFMVIPVIAILARNIQWIFLMMWQSLMKKCRIPGSRRKVKQYYGAVKKMDFNDAFMWLVAWMLPQATLYFMGSSMTVKYPIFSMIQIWVMGWFIGLITKASLNAKSYQHKFTIWGYKWPLCNCLFYFRHYYYYVCYISLIFSNGFSL